MDPSVRRLCKNSSILAGMPMLDRMMVLALKVSHWYQRQESHR